jgi:hypothetical protein
MELDPVSMNFIDLNPSLTSLSNNRCGAIAPWYVEQELCDKIFQSREFAKFRENDCNSTFTLKKEEDGSYTLESDNYTMRVKIENLSADQGFCGPAKHNLHFTITPK